MIFDATNLALPAKFDADLCVVGSGPGGAVVAMIAAEAGLRVVVLEAGPFVTPGEMSQREDEMIPKLFVLSGNQTTRDRGVKIHQGRGVGGSSLHNLNLCKRIPPSILEAWTRDFGLDALDVRAWDSLYADVEALLEVTTIDRAQMNRHNALLERGTSALGWRGGMLLHNRTGCVGSGFCELGCAYDAKNNAMKKVVPRAIEAGAELLIHTRAVRVAHDGKRVHGVEAVVTDSVGHRVVGTIVVDAPRVCLSASATSTAAILLRSSVPDPSGRTGKGLSLHPAVVCAAEFDEPVHAWRGIPQSFECTEFLRFDDRASVDHSSRRGVWIVPAFAHPMGFATMLPGFGDAHRGWMTRYAHLAALTAMVHDETTGLITPDGDLGHAIDYFPNANDRRALMLGLENSARLLFAAGARRVLVPTTPLRVLESPHALDGLADLPLEKGFLDLTAVHPLATVPMGSDPSSAPVDAHGRHHHLGGLWVADGSLFPSSIGVPPQLSIYALGLHVGRKIASAAVGSRLQ